MELLVLHHTMMFILSFSAAYLLIPLIVRLAYGFNILDCPDGSIKVHEKPVPYLGGIAVYIAFMSTLACFYVFEPLIIWLLLGSTILLFVGLIDDFAALRPGTKFLGQVLAVACFIRGGYTLKATFFSSAFNLAASGFWMLSIINAFNLIDVMDGLSSLVGLLVAVSFFMIALFFKCYSISLLLITFSGALLAFFVYNKPPAKIYLGDAGALFIGGLLSAIPLLLPWSSQSYESYYAAPVIFAIPALELLFLIIIRTRLGIPFYKGSPHHFSIYLMKKGWSKKRVLIFIIMMHVIVFVASYMYLIGLLTLYGFILLGSLFLCLWPIIIFTNLFQFEN